MPEAREINNNNILVSPMWIQDLGFGGPPNMGYILGPGALDTLNQNSSYAPSQSTPPMKICQICQDPTRSLYFGSIACDSCRAFFKRSIQRDAYKRFQCGFNNACEITKETRKGCPKCRFGRCMKFGMMERWMGRQGAKKKKEIMQKDNESKDQELLETTGVQPPSITYSIKLPEFMMEWEHEAIYGLCDNYLWASTSVTSSVPLIAPERRSMLEMIKIFTATVDRHTRFCRLIPEFQGLNDEDQGNLLRTGMFQMILLRGSMVFDAAQGVWGIGRGRKYLGEVPAMKVDDVQQITPLHMLKAQFRFLRAIQQLGVDEETVFLLMIISVLSWDRNNVKDKHNIALAQAKYSGLLRKYLVSKMGLEEGREVYWTLLKVLETLADLSDQNLAHSMTLNQREAGYVKNSLFEDTKVSMSPSRVEEVAEEPLNYQKRESVIVSSPPRKQQPISSSPPVSPKLEYRVKQEPISDVESDSGWDSYGTSQQDEIVDVKPRIFT